MTVFCGLCGGKRSLGSDKGAWVWSLCGSCRIRIKGLAPDTFDPSLVALDEAARPDDEVLALISRPEPQPGLPLGGYWG